MYKYGDYTQLTLALKFLHLMDHLILSNIMHPKFLQAYTNVWLHYIKVRSLNNNIHDLKEEIDGIYKHTTHY